MNTPLQHRAKTRLAPTPSGYLHAGNILSFAYTHALAKLTGAKVLLRIDDMDQARREDRYLQDVFDTLNFLGIPYDEGPKDIVDFDSNFSQVLRRTLYDNMLQALIDRNLVYACTCSRTDILKASPDGSYQGTCRHLSLLLNTPGAALRLKTDPHAILHLTDVFGNTTKHTLPATMNDFVVRKKEGDPAYQLTSLTDDLHFGVDLVVRGSDLFPSTLAQLYLAQLLNCQPFLHTTFHHHPLLIAADGQKLSKSAGTNAISQFRKTGTLPGDVLAPVAEYLRLQQKPKNWMQLVEMISLKIAGGSVV